MVSSPVERDTADLGLWVTGYTKRQQTRSHSFFTAPHHTPRARAAAALPRLLQCSQLQASWWARGGRMSYYR
jgi:hypothetical protein